MRFAKIVYLLAGCSGIIVLTPMYFLLNRIGTQTPPEVTHVEFYYGFVGVALAFQAVFLAISRDPIKYRVYMIPSILEKIAFSLPATILFLQRRLAVQTFVTSLMDVLWGILFLIAYFRTRPASAA